MHQCLKFILERFSTCFELFLYPSSGVFHCTHSNGICHTGFSDSLQGLTYFGEPEELIRYWSVCWLDDWEILFWYPAGTRDFLFFRASILALWPMPPATEWLNRATLWQREREADISPPPSTEVKPVSCQKNLYDTRWFKYDRADFCVNKPHMSRSCLNHLVYTIAVCTVKNSRWWTEKLSETCRVSLQNKFENLVYLVGLL